MICHTNRSNPLTGHRIGPPENLTAIAEYPLTGHRKKRQMDSDSLPENPLTGHRHKQTVIRQESCVSEMVTFRPSRDPIYRNDSTSLVVSVQSVDIAESSSTKEDPAGETVSIRTERNLMDTGTTPVMTSTTDNVSVVTTADENFPAAESQVSLFSHRRTPPRGSLSIRSERSSLYAERDVVVRSLHGTASTSFDRSPIGSVGVRSRPSSVCTESSTFGLRSRWAFASTEKIPMVTLLGRDRNKFEDKDDDVNESVESLELLPLESAQLELELAELKSNAKEKDRKRKTTVSLTQTKAMFQSFGNRLRKSLRRTKSNVETRSKPEVRSRKCSLNNVEKASFRPVSAPISGDFSPSLYTNAKSGVRPSSTSALSNSLENNRYFEKSGSIKSVDRNLVYPPDVPEKPLRSSFLRNSKSSLKASKEAITNTYVNLMAPVKCLAKDDSRLKDIARSKEYTRKSIRHANSNLESVNMKEPVIIRSHSNIETRSRISCTIENCPDILENAETKPSKNNIDISSLTIKRLEDKPTGRGSVVIEAYIPENENLSTFNGLTQCIPDMSPKTPPLLPSYRPPPMNSEPLSVKSGNPSKSSSSSKKRNGSDLSVSSYEDNENEPRVTLPSNLKRRVRVTKRPLKKRTNTENLSSGGSENANSSTTTTTTTTAQIACPCPQRDSDKSPSVNGKNGESGSNNTSDCSTPTASNTPNRKSLGTTREKRPKIMKGTDRKGVHKPMPVPPPVPGTLKSEFRQGKDNISNQSTSNLDSSNGYISTTPSPRLEMTSERKPSPQGPGVTAGSPGSDLSESGSTPTPIRLSVGPKKVWSRPVSSASTISNSSNDMCINFEQLLKEIVRRRTSQMQVSTENLPTKLESTS